MHKRLLVSGFLYHAKTEQILLHQIAPHWSMFGGISQNGESAQEVFTRIMQELINVKLQAKHIYPVYDYFSESAHKVHYIFYAEIKSMPTFPMESASILSWFTFKQTIKLAVREETKHDIIISERVIKAQARTNALTA
ncbi:hypothetical protein A2875_04465 [Candidatus Gottesmanbacteria bacterium RIFCSPHIGHO2_01_FULL_46_14]|uniref:Nudix hydrolase domain-containing protein n=2 Tax=Candidatus Gottesmaniibacteriota TaxID=1752720 RepID=A0A1F5ZJ32_9BACT|nr:MAG: hypothetical protein A2875_04465 [Candidatus Gottesmanbacteria bacterium RIFCSPHIGHO2_01_FULL_46_14]OGG29640.1 MAG: hypothetical protein A2971_01210 [Candidatus Gottesmanbacteria bacterium RIFCSPLOWO2_01_FULL_46_21]